MAICAKCKKSRDSTLHPFMRCNCDLHARLKKRWLEAEGKEPEPGKIFIGNVEHQVPKGGFRIKNGVIKSNRARSRAARIRKKALLEMDIKLLYNEARNADSQSEVERIDYIILTKQQELDSL